MNKQRAKVKDQVNRMVELLKSLGDDVSKLPPDVPPSVLKAAQKKRNVQQKRSRQAERYKARQEVKKAKQQAQKDKKITTEAEAKEVNKAQSSIT